MTDHRQLHVYMYVTMPRPPRERTIFEQLGEVRRARDVREPGAPVLRGDALEHGAQRSLGGRRAVIVAAGRRRLGGGGGRWLCWWFLWLERRDGRRGGPRRGGGRRGGRRRRLRRGRGGRRRRLRDGRGGRRADSAERAAGAQLACQTIRRERG